MAEDQNRTLQDKFMLRLPEGMRDRIRTVAETNNRSMNAEILATLEKAYPSLPEGAVSKTALINLLKSIEGIDREHVSTLAAKLAAQSDMVIQARTNKYGDIEFYIAPTPF